MQMIDMEEIYKFPPGTAIYIPGFDLIDPDTKATLADIENLDPKEIENSPFEIDKRYTLTYIGMSELGAQLATSFGLIIYWNKGGLYYISPQESETMIENLREGLIFAHLIYLEDVSAFEDEIAESLKKIDAVNKVLKIIKSEENDEL